MFYNLVRILDVKICPAMTHSTNPDSLLDFVTLRGRFSIVHVVGEDFMGWNWKTISHKEQNRCHELYVMKFICNVFLSDAL